MILLITGRVVFVIGELKQQNLDFSKSLRCSLIRRTNENCNVSLIVLKQYLNFGRKYDAAAAITDDLCRLPSKNSLIQIAKSIIKRLLSKEDESLTNSSHL